MSKYCVKKPFTVLVGVVLVLILGFVSFTGMTTDLLPAISLPYVVVVTTYPGASPEKVESEVTEPLESSLGTVNGVVNVTSTSSENYSMVMLEFEETTNMDSAMVKLSSAIDQTSASLPEMSGTPMMIEVSMDMMATMYVSVDYEGKDIYELSDFASETVIPYLERQNGVASVSASGLIEKTVEIQLEQSKIDDVNDKMLVKVSNQMADAKQQLDDAQAALDSAQETLDAQMAAMGGQLGDASAQADSGSAQLNSALTTMGILQQALAAARDQLGQLELSEDDITVNGLLHQAVDALGGDNNVQVMTPEELQAALIAQNEDGRYDRLIAALGEMDGQAALGLRSQVDEINQQRTQLQEQIAAMEKQLADAQSEMQGTVGQVQDAQVQLESGKLEAAVGFSTAQAQLTARQQDLAAAKTQYESARTEALKQANLDTLLSVSTLSQMIKAQNFSMPAGYIYEGEDQYLLKVGEAFDSVEDLQGALLCSIDGIGDVRLSDVANVTLVDNAGESYAKVNGNEAVLISVYKGSTAGTSEVSKGCAKAFAELEEKYPGLRITPLMDQGDYIKLIINSVLSNLIYGAILAIIVLAIFLKDWKPTIVVAFSIPLSVLFAIVLMYFTNITLNLLSLSGLALGVGMLVDNSVVVIENIYRLRSRGVPAARAAVQGARQVAGAIAASTLTTICVFLPLLFTTGMTRELLQDMGLTITYSLLASLAVALTVVPSMSATLLRNNKPKTHPWFDKMIAGYEKSLRFCLAHKLLPLGAAIVLLAFSAWQVTRMGMTMIPEMGGNQMTVSMTVPDGVEKEDAYATADAALERMTAVEGVDTVGAMSGSASSGLLGSMTGGGGEDFIHYEYYVMLTDEGSRHSAQVSHQVEQALADLDAEVTVSSSSMNLGSMMTSGLTLNIYGDDLDTLLSISQDLMELLGKVDGFTDITNGQEDGDPLIRIDVDKDAAMRLGLTVAQVYAELSGALTTEATSTTLDVGDETYTVVVKSPGSTLDVDTLLDYEFTTNTMDDTGNSVSETHTLGEFASQGTGQSMASISRENQSRTLSVTATTEDGYNTTLLSRQVQDLLDSYEVPEGYTVELAGESSEVADMMVQLIKMIALAIAFIYLIMVAQFQSLLSPFIVLFTIPLAFTGGLIGLLVTGELLSMISMMGFLVLAGVVVNNGIVFVDYTNQLRLDGLEKREALVATGKTRMRPILMTAMTTILAMFTMLFSNDAASSMSKGMAVVVVGGLTYATLMTLYIVPVMYDLVFRRKLERVDVGEDGMDDLPDDAAQLIEELKRQREAEGMA